jgi:hypothetical protein
VTQANFVTKNYGGTTEMSSTLMHGEANHLIHRHAAPIATCTDAELTQAQVGVADTLMAINSRYNCWLILYIVSNL